MSIPSALDTKKAAVYRLRVLHEYQRYNELIQVICTTMVVGSTISILAVDLAPWIGIPLAVIFLTLGWTSAKKYDVAAVIYLEQRYRDLERQAEAIEKYHNSPEEEYRVQFLMETREEIEMETPMLNSLLPFSTFSYARAMTDDDYYKT